MKQLLRKSMATRLLGILVTFFMMAAAEGTAQVQSGGSGASGGHSRSETADIPPPRANPQQPAIAKKSAKNLPLHRNAKSGNVIKIGQNEYADWESAIKVLREKDEIVLLKDLYLDASTATIPDKACTISGANGSRKILGYTENGVRKNLLMKAPMTFKYITLDMAGIIAGGYALVLDEGIDVSDEMKSPEPTFIVWGGGAGADVESTSITVKSGTYSAIYGGGSGNTDKVKGKATVNILGGTFDWVHGGGGAGSNPTVGETEVIISGGTIKQAYAGGLSGDVENDTKLIVKDNAYIVHAFGGGYSGRVKGTCYMIIEGGTIYADVYGGGKGETATCGNTDVVVSGGTIGHVEQGYRFHLMGGGYEAPVMGKAKVTINGGTFNCFVTAGGGQDAKIAATCGSTELNISGGTFSNWTYGGGWAAPVGTATVRVTGSPALTTLCGGGVRPTASCENTDVHVSSDIGGWLFAGGEVGPVNGTAKLTVTGGRIANNIYGGCTSAFCNRTEITISGGEARAVFGGGEGNGSIVNEANLTVSGGTFSSVIGSGFTDITADPQPNGYVKDVNMLITGGIIDYLSMTSTITNDTPTPVTGKMSLTIEGNNARIGSTISKNDHCPDKDKKEAVLTFKNCGTQNAPFETPCIDGFTTIKLDNSFVKPIKRSPYSGGEIYASPDIPFSITGEGLVVNGNEMTVVYNGFKSPTLGFPLFSMENIPAGMTFKMLVGNPNSQHTIYPTFKAGNYIFPAQTTPDNKLTLRDITITYPLNGTLSVQWGKIGLESGDKVPDNTKLALLLTPNSGYQGGTIYVDGNPLTGNTCQVTSDVTFKVEGITRIPDPEPDPVPSVYHTVTIPVVEGAATDPVAGDYDIEAWSSFHFYLTLDKDYDQSEPVVTTDRGETIQPRSSDGAYIVKYVRSDVKITIDGVVKNSDPVANAEIRSGTKAWVNNHRLFIRTDKQEKVFIYTFDGQLRKTLLSAGGEEHIVLSSGSYIVCIGESKFKVIL